jgi:hypothetical protein
MSEFCGKAVVMGLCCVGEAAARRGLRACMALLFVLQQPDLYYDEVEYGDACTVVRCQKILQSHMGRWQAEISYLHKDVHSHG